MAQATRSRKSEQANTEAQAESTSQNGEQAKAKVERRVIAARFSENQAFVIDQVAALTGMKPSDFVRDAALEKVHAMGSPEDLASRIAQEVAQRSLAGLQTDDGES